MKKTQKGKEDISTVDSIHSSIKGVKNNQKKDQKNNKKGTLLNLDLGRFTGIETPPLSLSASLPHDALEHTENPNVLVAHTSQGIEVRSMNNIYYYKI